MVLRTIKKVSKAWISGPYPLRFRSTYLRRSLGIWILTNTSEGGQASGLQGVVDTDYWFLSSDIHSSRFWQVCLYVCTHVWKCAMFCFGELYAKRQVADPYSHWLLWMLWWKWIPNHRLVWSRTAGHGRIHQGQGKELCETWRPWEDAEQDISEDTGPFWRASPTAEYGNQLMWVTIQSAGKQREIVFHDPARKAVVLFSTS